jgi:gamma-glutamyl:cysteine ligase YbdK (ATP-grasp superfamily)
MHINLPFGDDEEFGRLHAAIRLLLPILPALAASSPIVDGVSTGLLDSRLEMYRQNCSRVPSVTGRVIPEPVFRKLDYETQILAPMFQEIAPHDTAGVLQEEFLNARGAIARFNRDAIEIRVLDLQECPRADLAVASFICTVLQQAVAETWQSYAEQQLWTVERLEAIFLAALKYGDEAVVRDTEYLKAFGFPGVKASLGELWSHLFGVVAEKLAPSDRACAQSILDAGPLARRILRAAGPFPGKERLHAVYHELSDCLATGSLFRA